MGVASDVLEDVVQDAYLRLLNAESVTQVRDSRSYFAKAATSVVLTHVRRARCVTEEAHDVVFFARLQSPDPSPDLELDGKRKLAKIGMTIDRMGERTRQVVILRRVEQLTCRETAERMGISERAVEKHLSAAMRRVKEAHAAPDDAAATQGR
jgi:RNA polymerase sigma-70 factor (ECF subfamily)